jgi:hypothetical protein
MGIHGLRRQIVLLEKGVWNPMAIIVPGIVIAIPFRIYRRCDDRGIDPRISATRAWVHLAPRLTSKWIGVIQTDLNWVRLREASQATGRQSVFLRAPVGLSS